jgi:uncharacterized protein (TIGR03083 family)
VGQGVGRELDPDAITPIRRDEMRRLARTEYLRLLELLDDLEDDEWSLPTDCDGWAVRDIVAHLAGTAEANASLRENRRQVVSGRRLARRHGLTDLDGINRLQVESKAHLSPRELHSALDRVAANAVRGRFRTPKPLRRFWVTDPSGGTMTVGFLVDVVYTRDQWMHRIDISRATDRPLTLTTDHDGRIVADVVRQWARRHDEPVHLELTGPAGDTYRRGDAPMRVEIDAVEFCRALSGRSSLPDELPDVSVPF